jgi:hypothetical protein
MARVTTSASSPSTTARACVPEPPCDCLMVRFAAEYFGMKAAFSARHSSRVGS